MSLNDKEYVNIFGRGVNECAFFKKTCFKTYPSAADVKQRKNLKWPYVCKGL